MVYVPIVLVRTFGFGKAIIQYMERLTGHDAALRVLSRMRVDCIAPWSRRRCSSKPGFAQEIY